MDKVDIYRVLYEEFKFEFDKNEISKKVLNTFNKKQSINIKDIKSKTDSILSQIAFLYDINFKESFKKLFETNEDGNLKMCFKGTCELLLTKPLYFVFKGKDKLNILFSQEKQNFFILFSQET